MADDGRVYPNNDIITGTYKTQRLAIGANATLAKMIPGALVIFDVNDHDVKESGANGDVIGWLGYGMAHSTFKPATRATAYAALADEVPVQYDVSGLVLAPCASTSFVKGDLLTSSTDGLVKAATLGTDYPVGKVAKSTTTATTVWVESHI